MKKTKDEYLKCASSLSWCGEHPNDDVMTAEIDEAFEANSRLCLEVWQDSFQDPEGSGKWDYTDQCFIATQLACERAGLTSPQSSKAAAT